MLPLHTTDLSIGYSMGRRPPRIVLRDVRVALAVGEFACLLGPNGCGKSTLLRTLAGIQKPLTGTVWIGDGDLNQMALRDRARRVGVVLTEHVRTGNLSVVDLVGLGRYPHTGWRGTLTARDKEIVNWALAITHSQDLASRMIGEISDGERQRVMIARALAQEPRLLLLDEPTAFLDLPRRIELIGLLRNLAHTTGLAVLLSIHDLDLAIQTADTIWLVEDRGNLVDGVPEDLVLNGLFDRVFSTSDLTFDLASGRFRPPHRTGRKVRVQGDDPCKLWTRHALERIGFSVFDEPDETADPDLDVACIKDGDGWRWQVATSNIVKEYETVKSLISSIRTACALCTH